MIMNNSNGNDCCHDDKSFENDYQKMIEFEKGIDPHRHFQSSFRILEENEENLVGQFS
ncbi:hypothetical protein Glove_199g144 [Diversispora epigaea]|uniref:Uncharacterized protein n=1 Tax=Diversispora epigaea TaxID=1348612 RepID=A0A397INC5_9GLOM|nr:hypothetical protein Glove_199g144 [Diversispora epigaea]